MTMRLLLAATLAAGLSFAPAAFAQDAMKPAISKKTHKAAKAQKKSGKIRKTDEMPASPYYSTQKDEMTR